MPPRPTVTPEMPSIPLERDTFMTGFIQHLVSVRGERSFTMRFPDISSLTAHGTRRPRRNERHSRRRMNTQTDSVSQRIDTVAQDLYGGQHWLEQEQDEPVVQSQERRQSFPLPPEAVARDPDLLVKHFGHLSFDELNRVTNQLHGLRSIVYGFMTTSNGPSYFYASKDHLNQLCSSIDRSVNLLTGDEWKSFPMMANLYDALDCIRTITSQRSWDVATHQMERMHRDVPANTRRLVNEEIREPDSWEERRILISGLVVAWARKAVRNIDMFYTVCTFSKDELQHYRPGTEMLTIYDAPDDYDLSEFLGPARS